MASKLRFSYVESERDLEQYGELLRLAFPGEGVDILGRRLYDSHPEMTSRNFLALWEGETMVATLNLIPQTWSLGGVPLKMAEMGLVGTRPSHRNRGLQRVLNVEFDRRLREDGYNLAGLEGIPYFYRQFGYEYSVTLDESASIPLAKIPLGDATGISPLNRDEMPRAMSVLEASQRRLLVHSIRSRGEWETQERLGIVGEHVNKTFAVKDGGKMIAYFRASIEEKAVVLHEISDTDDDASERVMAFLRQMGEKEGATELVSREGYDSPFDGCLLRLGATRKRPYAWQMKIVDPTSLFEKLRTLFEERIANSPLGTYTGAVPINLYNVIITMTIKNGKVEKIARSPGEQKGEILINPRVFPKLLLGYRSLSELEEEYPDIRIKPEYKPLIDVLFPKGSGHIHTCY